MRWPAGCCPGASFFMYRRAMRRSSGYTCSASRARAASSPLPQAFNRFVISAERASMDSPFSPGTKNIPKRGRFCRPLPPVPAEGEQALRMISSKKQETTMKHIATVALMLNLGVAGVYAQQRPVKMTFSGTNVATTINLQPNTVTDEQHSAGNGTFGSFTFRELHADWTGSPTPERLLRPQFCGCGRRRRISLPGRKFVNRHGQGWVGLYQSRRRERRPYRELSDHRWNRAFRGCVRRSHLYGDHDGGIVQRL